MRVSDGSVPLPVGFVCSLHDVTMAATMKSNVTIPPTWDMAVSSLQLPGPGKMSLSNGI